MSEITNPSVEEAESTSRLVRLESEMDDLRGLVSQLRAVVSQYDGPYPMIFQAKTEDGATWEEWALQTGEMKLYQDGRRVTNSTSGAIIADVGDTITLMEVRDFDSEGVPLTRYIPIGGTLPKGQYQFMGYFMVSQNQAGWDFARAHGILPE